MLRAALLASLATVATVSLAGPVGATAPIPAVTATSAIAVTGENTVVLLSDPSDPAATVTTLATGVPNANDFAATYDAVSALVYVSVCCNSADEAGLFTAPAGGAVGAEPLVAGAQPVLSPDGTRLAYTTATSVVIRTLADSSEESITFTEAEPFDVLWKDDASLYVTSYSRSAQRPVVTVYTPAGEQLAVHVVETVPFDVDFGFRFAGIGPDGALTLLFAIEGRTSQLLGFDAETLAPVGEPVDLGAPMISLDFSASGESLWVGEDQALHVGDGPGTPGQYRWAAWV